MKYSNKLLIFSAEEGISLFTQMGAISSAGRAPRLHRGGRRFKPVIAHHIFLTLLLML